MPSEMALLGWPIWTSWPSMRTCSGVHGQLAEDDLGQLAAAGADEPREADDLAGLDVERDALVPVTLDVPDLDHDAVRRGAVAVEDLAQVAADHVADDLVLGQRRSLLDHDQLAVAQDGHAVGDAHDLVESMADVDDGHALGAEPAHECEELFDLLVGQ